MKKSKRKNAPNAVQAQVLIRCRRRCCLCFFWDNDITQKEGQLAHLDRNHNNSSEENLVYLCAKHHNQYDSKQSQGKNITPSELSHARSLLLKKMNDDPTPEFTVTLELDREFSTYTDEDQEELIEFIRHLLKRRGEVKVVKRRRGSVLITLSLNSEETVSLFKAIEAGNLTPFGVISATIESVSDKLLPLSFMPSYTVGISIHGLPMPQAHEILTAPHKAQYLRNGNLVSRKDARCLIALRRYGGRKSGDAYSALVVSFVESQRQRVVAGFRVYNSEVYHSDATQPLRLLEGFLDVFGVDITFKGVGTQRLFRGLFIPAPAWVRTVSDALRYVKLLQDQASNSVAVPIERISICDLDPTNRTIIVELEFGISETKYAQALCQHGVSVPRKFLP
jgi:hypothetical protein